MTYSYLTLVDSNSELEEAQAINASRPFSAAKTRVNAVASVVEAASKFANDASVEAAISDSVSGLEPDLDAAAQSWADQNETGKCYDPAQVGALVHILLTRPLNWPDPRPISFQQTFLAACDLNPVDALNKYLATPAAFQGPPEGTEQLWKFLWRSA